MKLGGVSHRKGLADGALLLRPGVGDSIDPTPSPL